MTIEEKLATLRRPERRRFRQVCRANAYTTPSNIAKKQAQFIDYSDYTPNLLTDELQWLFDQAVDLNIDLETHEWKTYWLSLRAAVRSKYFDYRAKPIPQGRDNKNVFNGSGYGSGHSIRYPRKVRSKKCWERFHKLFPYARPKLEEPEITAATPRRFPTSGAPPKFKPKKK